VRAFDRSWCLYGRSSAFEVGRKCDEFNAGVRRGGGGGCVRSWAFSGNLIAPHKIFFLPDRRLKEPQKNFRKKFKMSHLSNLLALDPKIRDDFFVRFWSRVDFSGECWLWLGPVHTNGYGRLWITRRLGKRKKGKAHRTSYELVYGPIPDDILVCHHCDTKLCVRPNHLFLGTDADNMDDKTRKGRTPSGEDHWNWQGGRMPGRRPGEGGGSGAWMRGVLFPFLSPPT
jgi:hypothetical protein